MGEDKREENHYASYTRGEIRELEEMLKDLTKGYNDAASYLSSGDKIGAFARIGVGACASAYVQVRDLLKKIEHAQKQSEPS